MIDRAEIEAASQHLGVHTSHVQRDYVFGWLLAGLYNKSNPLAGKLILKGGNAFRKAYFENARFSNDLDFSTQSTLREQDFKSGIAVAARTAGELSRIDFTAREPVVRVRPMADGETRLHEARVYFRSFYGDENVSIKVELDVSEYDQIFLPVQQRRLIHAYSDTASCHADIRCWKLEELLASKLKALLHRQHSPDLYDFVYALFVQRALDVNRLEIVQTALKKTIYEQSPDVLRGLLLDLPFNVFRDLWNEFLVLPKLALVAFEEAEEHFRESIASLFDLLVPQPLTARPFGARETLSPSHFRGEQRALILEAGRTQKVLSIIYDGVARRVEPYALTFKRRKDGVGQEYFYAWDRSGGRSGQVGIKSFLADKVQLVEATSESFAPRYPIELVKGVTTGIFSSPTFTTPGSYGTRPTSQRNARGTSSGRAYSVTCPYCNKKFSRERPETRLNKHTDRYGNPCPGRVGFLS